jgi:hypothetical protein
LSAGVVLEVQVIPSGLVITLLAVPVLLTATNKVSSLAQITEDQLLSVAEVLIVQVIPSGLVITLSVVPVELTAANKVNSGDQQTEVQL